MFAIPGDRGFPLGGLVGTPANRQEADAFRQYFTQVGRTGVDACFGVPVGNASIFLSPHRHPSHLSPPVYPRLLAWQARRELGERLIERVYNEDGTLSKWWMCFSKKNFMGKSLDAPGAN